MGIRGYKCFNEDLTNRYGFKFCVGKTYTTSENVKFGVNGIGFHMCKNLEDTFRYFDAVDGNICMCEVIGSGNMVKYSDEYYGYYDMYSVEKLEIIKKLTREEIINYGLCLDPIKVRRFISGLKLTEEELNKFKKVFSNNQDVMDAISYYQENDINIYKRNVYKKSR